jgi:hypothetical protein
MKRFIDDVAIEVIEVGLVSTVVDILSPVEVYKMNAELVADIAGESKENQTHREQLNKQAKEPKSARNSYSLRSQVRSLKLNSSIIVNCIQRKLCQLQTKYRTTHPAEWLIPKTSLHIVKILLHQYRRLLPTRRTLV